MPLFLSYHKLYSLCDQWLYDLREQIKTLLIGQARDHCQQRRIGTYRQMRELLQVAIILGPLLQRMHVKLGVDIAISGGINFLIVDAVEDAEEAVAARPQEVIEFLAEGRR